MLALLIAGGAFLFARDAQAGEVFLVPAASTGPDPFSATPFAPAPDPAIAKPAAPAGAPVPASTGARPVQAASGSAPGLYGGTRNMSACDAAQMVTFLGANPDKAQAWVNALTADPAVKLRDGRPLTTATIPDYVAGLTSIVLRADTRVTNHGFKNGRQTVLQSVLQKGSAVMVDNFGVPRVKCFCGNPLLPPVPSSRTVSYKGPRWPDFDESKIIVVQPPPEPVEEFVVCEPTDPSQCYSVPPGGVPTDPIAPPDDQFAFDDPPEFEEDGSDVPPDEGVEEGDPFPPADAGPPDDYVDDSDEEASYPCSQPAGAPAQVTVVNHRSAPVTIVYLDESCERRVVGQIGPGESGPLQTSAGHMHEADGTESRFVASPGSNTWDIY